MIRIKIREAAPNETGCWACRDIQPTNVVELHHVQSNIVRMFGLCDIHLFDLRKEIDEYLKQAYEPKNFTIPESRRPETA